MNIADSSAHELCNASGLDALVQVPVGDPTPDCIPIHIYMNVCMYVITIYADLRIRLGHMLCAASFPFPTLQHPHTSTSKGNTSYKNNPLQPPPTPPHTESALIFTHVGNHSSANLLFPEISQIKWFWNRFGFFWKSLAALISTQMHCKVSLLCSKLSN